MGHVRISQQVHSYKNGHALAGASLRLERSDQDQVDKLSDLAGPLGPGQTFKPYLTLYPLPSESHYVVACTWQDLSAPRAGCVITRSLLVPMKEWRLGGLMSVLQRALIAIGPDISSFNEIEVHREIEAEYLPVVASSASELVEAIFLEKRQPIAVFGSNDGDLIATRLLEGVWPAMRCALAICTHANSPRSLQGRPFDLLFAPAIARSNFASWYGRKVDGTQSKRPPRHHWTEQISSRLFQGSRIEPLSVSIGGMTANLDDADEGQFRLAMFWSELEEKVDESPLAILGMLDILSSLRQDRQALDQALRPILLKSISLAQRSFNGIEFFDYLNTLLAKFPSRLPPTSALSAIRRYACSAATSEPSSALEFLEGMERNNSPVPVVLCAGIGNGFSNTQVVVEHLLRIFSLSDEVVFGLISHSRAFARSFILVLEEQSDLEKFIRLARMLSAVDTKLRDRAARNLLPVMRSGLESSLLELLLANVPSRKLSRAVRQLWEANQFKVEEFDSVLISVANTDAKILEMRSVLIELPSSTEVTRLLLRTLRIVDKDVRWILEESITSTKQCYLLNELILRSETVSLRSLEISLMERVLQLLSQLVAENCYSMAKLLLVQKVPIGLFLDMAPQVLRCLKGELHEKVVSLVVSRALFEGVGSDVSRVFDEFAAEVPARDLAFMLSPPNLCVDQVSRNLLLVANSSNTACDAVLGRVDLLTDHLIARRGAIPTSSAVSAWAELIRRSGRIDTGAQLRAASAVLEWALKLTHLDVSSLVVVAFPLIYQQLKLATDTASFMTLFTLVDWDRCKIARKDLMSAFLKSVWPRSDLFLIAELVEEFESIARLLARSNEGRSYIRESLRDEAIPVHLRHDLAIFLKRS